MNLRTLFWLSVITGCLMAPIAQGQSVTLDGFYDSSNARSYAYSNTELSTGQTVTNYNNDQWLWRGQGCEHRIQATMSLRVWTLPAIPQPTRTYFFLYVEAPLDVQGMSWAVDAATIIADL